MFIEYKRLYTNEGEVPEGDYTIPFGKADIKRAGQRRHDRGHRAHGRQSPGGSGDAGARGH